MDYSGITRGSIRAEALKKLAELTVQNPSSNLKEVNTGIQKMIFPNYYRPLPNYSTQGVN